MDVSLSTKLPMAPVGMSAMRTPEAAASRDASLVSGHIGGKFMAYFRRLALSLGVDPVALLAHCAGRLTAFAVPRYVRTVEALPLTPSQRVEKYRLPFTAGPNGGAGRGDPA